MNGVDASECQCVVNQVVLSGELIDVEPIRYTPAGVPILSFTLRHHSCIEEAGGVRQVDCEIPGVCLGPLSVRLQAIPANNAVVLSGFLAARHHRWKRALVFHATALA